MKSPPQLCPVPLAIYLIMCSFCATTAPDMQKSLALADLSTAGDVFNFFWWPPSTLPQHRPCRISWRTPFPVRRAPPGMHLIMGHNKIPAIYSSKPGHHRSSAETKIGHLCIAFSHDCESIAFEQPTRGIPHLPDSMKPTQYRTKQTNEHYRRPKKYK